MKQQKVLAKSE